MGLTQMKLSRVIFPCIVYVLGMGSAIAGQISVINPSSGSSVVISIPQSSPSAPNSYSGSQPTSTSVGTMGESRLLHTKDVTVENILKEFRLSATGSDELIVILQRIETILANKNLPRYKKIFLENEKVRIMNAMPSLEN